MFLQLKNTILKTQISFFRNIVRLYSHKRLVSVRMTATGILWFLLQFCHLRVVSCGPPRPVHFNIRSCLPSQWMPAVISADADKWGELVYRAWQPQPAGGRNCCRSHKIPAAAIHTDASGPCKCSLKPGAISFSASMFINTFCFCFFHIEHLAQAEWMEYIT